MTVQLNIEYDKLVELVKQLSYEQRKDLITQLLSEQAQQRPLTIEEKIQLLDAAQLDHEVNEIPSVRRADWYNDDGR